MNSGEKTDRQTRGDRGTVKIQERAIKKIEMY